jgi:hypothetical protein
MTQERVSKTAAMKERWAQEREEKLKLQQEEREEKLRSSRAELQELAEKRKINRIKEQQRIVEQNARKQEELKALNDDRACLV